MQRLSVVGVMLFLVACGSSTPEPARNVPIAVTIYAPTPAPATPTQTSTALSPAATSAPVDAAVTVAERAPTSTPLPRLPSESGDTKVVLIENVPPADDAEGVRALLLALLNQARTSNSLPALTASSILQQAAQLHAQDLSQTGQGSHAGSDGSTFQDRIKRAGYPGSVLNLNEAWAWQADPQGASEWWMNDANHRPIILSVAYTEVGFGVARNAKGGFFFVANLGSPSP